MKYSIATILLLASLPVFSQVKYTTTDGVNVVAVNADGSSDTLSTAYQVKGEYRAIIAHQNSDEPIVMVLQNTLGSDVSWSHTTTGTITGTVSGITLTENKTYCTAQLQQRGSNPRTYTLGRATDATVVLTSMNSSLAATDPSSLNYVAVNIIVYQ